MKRIKKLTKWCDGIFWHEESEFVKEEKVSFFLAFILAVVLIIVAFMKLSIIKAILLSILTIGVAVTFGRFYIILFILMGETIVESLKK